MVILRLRSRLTRERRKLAVEEEVRVDSLQEGEECWISNGVRGFIFGKVKVHSSAAGGAA